MPLRLSLQLMLLIHWITLHNYYLLYSGRCHAYSCYCRRRCSSDLNCYNISCQFEHLKNTFDSLQSSPSNNTFFFQMLLLLIIMLEIKIIVVTLTPFKDGDEIEHHLGAAAQYCVLFFGLLLLREWVDLEFFHKLTQQAKSCQTFFAINYSKKNHRRQTRTLLTCYQPYRI